MARKIYTSEQNIRKLREAEVLMAEGMITRNAARQIGITEQTYFRWRKEYGGMKVNQAKRLSCFGNCLIMPENKHIVQLIFMGIPVR